MRAGDRALPLGDEALPKRCSGASALWRIFIAERIKKTRKTQRSRGSSNSITSATWNSTDDLVEVSRTLYRAERYDEAQTRLVSILRTGSLSARGDASACRLCLYEGRLRRGDLRVAAHDAYRPGGRRVRVLSCAHAPRQKRQKPSPPRDRAGSVLLPESEAMRRLVRIHKALEDIPAARQKWKNRQREFLSLIRWGCEQAGLRKTMSVFLCMMGDERAATILRGMLLHPSADRGLEAAYLRGAQDHGREGAVLSHRGRRTGAGTRQTARKRRAADDADGGRASHRKRKICRKTRRNR